MSPADSAADSPAVNYQPSRHMGAAVAWLLGLNIAVYFLQVTVVSPSDMFAVLGFHSKDLGTLGRAWWTIGTYMFVHGGFWHLALNMYTLWLFGPRVEAAWTPGEFTRFYLFCGLGGWFLHLFMAGDSVLIGASAAVMGVMLAYATLWPHEMVYLFGLVPITVRWLMVLVVLMNLLGGISASPDGNGIAYLAHLGGLAAGGLYLRTSARMSLAGVRRHVEPVPDLPEEDLPRAVPKSHRPPRGRDADDAVARSKAVTSRRVAASPQQPAETAAPRESDAARLDRVLDKISATGLASLTPEELQLLDDASKRRRHD